MDRSSLTTSHGSGTTNSRGRWRVTFTWNTCERCEPTYLPLGYRRPARPCWWAGLLPTTDSTVVHRVADSTAYADLATYRSTSSGWSTAVSVGTHEHLTIISLPTRL